MRVAMIGMGAIARKAYLPVLAASPGITPVLVSRDAARLADLAATWRIAETHGDVESLLARGVDAAFVHAATAAHEAIVTRLLEAGVPTHVDKPLADSYAAASRLVDLAEQRGVSLMAGFNRRHAPAVRALLQAPRSLIVLHKHRVDQAGDPRTVIFDDFIHVVDTLRFLLPGPLTGMTVHPMSAAGGDLVQVGVTLSAAGACAIGLMNRRAGINEEVLEVSGDGVRHRVLDLADTAVAGGGVQRALRRDDWAPVADVRGFAGLCAHFLDAVRAGRRLCARDALETHRLCEEIVAATTAA